MNHSTSNVQPATKSSPADVIRESNAVPTNLKGSAVRGGLVVVCTQGVKFTLRLLSMMVLARLLSPNDFGLVAMVTSITGILAIFSYAGLSLATVQRKEITEAQISTLYWINMALGCCLAFVSIAAAPLLAAFYHEPRIYGVAMGVAVSFVFSAASTQHQALLQRRLRYGMLASIEITALVVSSVVAIAMAWNGFGYWALVAQTVVVAFVSAAGAWIVLPWLPGAPVRNCGAWSMVRLGGVVTINSLTMYIAYNADKILLGRYWGAEALGLYGRAYQLVNLPTDQLHSSIGTVAFSALPRLQSNPRQLAHSFLIGYALVLSLTVPITVVSVLFARDLVLLALGPKWGDVVPVFRLLVPTILVFGVINPFGWLLVSSGNAVKSMKIGFVIAPLVILAYIGGLQFGPAGVATCYSLTMVLLTVPLVKWFIAGTAITGWEVAKVISRPLLSAAVAIIAGVLVQNAVGSAFTPVVRLALGTSVVAGIYGAVLIVGMNQKALYLDLLHQLRKTFRGGADQRQEILSTGNAREQEVKQCIAHE